MSTEDVPFTGFFDDHGSTELNAFFEANSFLTDFVRLFGVSQREGRESPRTKSLRRLCRSQLSEVRHTLTALLDDEATL